MKKVLIVLFSGAVLLLLSHVILSMAFPESNTVQLLTMSDDEVVIRFNACLKSFDVKDEWFKRVNKKTAMPTFVVRLPNDLRIPQILFELTKQYEGYNVQINSVEKEINGKTTVQIFSEKELKLKADFNYDKNIQRTSSPTVLFVYGRENREAEFDSLMRNSPRDYSVLLAPTKSSADYTKWLRENGFEYAVMIKADSPDLEFRLENDFPIKRVKMIVQNMVASFPNALFYIFEPKSNISYSSVGELIKSELEKRKIKFFTSDSLKFLETNDKNISERFTSFVKSADVVKINRIAISYDAFIQLNEELKKLIRVGSRFLSTSSLQNEMAKTSK